MNTCKSHKRLAWGGGVLCIVGIILVAIGIVGLTYLPALFQSLVSEKLPIKEDSATFKNWRNSSVSIYFKLYVFNLTNPTEFEAGQRPNLSEIGPFTYLETREKVSFNFSSDGKYLNYTERKLYIFQPNLSVADPKSVNITGVNPLLLTLLASVGGHPIIETVISQVAWESVFITRTAHEFIWGYKDELVNDICDLFGVMCDYRVAWLKDANATVSPPTVINTGLTDLKRIGKIESYNGQTALTTWQSDIANAINGSDGSMFPPFLSTSDLVYVFASDVCRSFKFESNGVVTAKNDDRIKLYSFIGTRDQAQNASVNPENAGFCPAKTAGPPCPPAGMMDLTPCKSKSFILVPIYASQPHFYLADPSIRATFDGIREPNEDDQTNLNIQPILGVPLEAYKRLQMNMFFKATDKESKFFKDIKRQDYYFPMFWLEESAVADAATLDRLYQAVLKKQSLMDNVTLLLLSFGIIFCLLALGLFIVIVVHRQNFIPVDTADVNADDVHEERKPLHA